MMENNPLYTKVKVTKSLYQAWDSYQRRQKWNLQQMLIAINNNGPLRKIVKDE